MESQMHHDKFEHWVPGNYWHRIDDKWILCDLCPRACKLKSGQRGYCFQRANHNNQMVLTMYGHATGFCVDPIEKKPLNHFYPGSSVLSFGTAGCNLGCRFCQNSDISKTREISSLCVQASPRDIAELAVKHGCQSVAYTYNDPTIFIEYVLDVARECHQHGLKNVAVSAGYISPEARQDLYQLMDAANIDLKAFTEDFYHDLTASSLKPVLETLLYLYHETQVWLEITTLLIPGHNDTEKEIKELSSWVAQELGPEVPLHFTAFHPSWKMLDTPHTLPETVKRARAIARDVGLQHVYTGNIRDPAGQKTLCSNCNTLLIERNRYQVLTHKLDHTGLCPQCGMPCPGHFALHSDGWGNRRLNVRPV